MCGQEAVVAVTEQAESVVTLEALASVATEALDRLAQRIECALFDRLEQANAPLREEIATLQARAGTLRESHAALRPRVEAQARLLATAIDEAVASGRDDEAAQKRAETAELQTNLETIQSEAAACDARVVALTRQHSKNVETIFEQTYSEIRHATVGASTALACLLDKTWATLCRYDGENKNALMGRGLADMRRKSGLTPDETGIEKPAFWSLKLWFQGRI